MSLGVQRLSRSVRRQQILQAAKELFAKQGFEGTTTRLIADRVGINEAILFRHFPHKEDLYWAIIESECRRCGEGGISKKNLSGIQDDRRVFQAIAKEILQHSEQDASLMRLLLYSALEDHGLSHRFFQSYIAERYEVLANYIRRRIREGAFRTVDAHLAARSFVGMVIYHELIQELFGGKLVRQFGVEHVSRTLTDIWLEGMRSHRANSNRRGHQH